MTTTGIHRSTCRTAMSGILLVLLIRSPYFIVAGRSPFSSASVGRVTLKLPDNTEVMGLSAPFQTGDANLMLPPAGNPDMCPSFRRELQHSIQDNTVIDRNRALYSGPRPRGKYDGRNKDSAFSEVSEEPAPSAIAILVSQDGCSLRNKALAVHSHQVWHNAWLKHVIFPGVDLDDGNGVRIPSDATFLGLSNGARITIFGDMNYIFVSPNDWNLLSEQLSRRLNTTEASPHIGNNENENWNYRMEIRSAYPDQRHPFGIFFVTIIAFVVMVSCCAFARLCYRRRRWTEQFAASPSATAPIQQSKKLLTHEQVMELPEVVYPVGNIRAGNVADKDERQATTETAKTASKSSTEDDQGKLSHQSGESDSVVVDNDDTEQESSGSMCSICIHDYEVGERLRLLPECRHVFHTECILPWLTERQSSCPYCKTEVCAILNEEDEGLNNVEETSVSSQSIQEGIARGETDRSGELPV